jgi:hypothetical protein
MRISWFALVVALTLAPRPAAAVSVHDIIELTRAGLGDEVIVALVETSGLVYTLSPQQVVELKRAGVSERVIVLMLRQGRTNLAVPEPALPETPMSPPLLPYGATWQTGGVPAMESPAFGTPSTVVVVVPGVGYPVFVPGKAVHFSRAHKGPRVDRSGGFGRFINDGYRTGTPIAVWGPTAAPKSGRGHK